MILTLSCPDLPGLVARVPTPLFEHGANIVVPQPLRYGEPGRLYIRAVIPHGIRGAAGVRRREGAGGSATAQAGSG